MLVANNLKGICLRFYYLEKVKETFELLRSLFYLAIPWDPLWRICCEVVFYYP